MNQIAYDQRSQTYMNALIRYGEKGQCVVALEELSECQKEICKVLRGQGKMKKKEKEIELPKRCVCGGGSGERKKQTGQNVCLPCYFNMQHPWKMGENGTGSNPFLESGC